MGANKKLYGYYPTTPEWLPVKVDSAGKVVINNIPAHHLTHELGGGDVISLANLGTVTRARAYLSANQLNLVSGTWTKVLLNAESYDVGDNFANYKFTAPVTGYYLVTGAVRFTALITAKDYGVGLYKSAARLTNIYIHSSSAYDLSGEFTDIVYLTAAETLELYAYSDAGVNTVDIFGWYNSTYLAVNLLQV